MKKCGHLSSQKSVTVWRKYLLASEKSYLALSENAMDCWILSYHKLDINPRRYRFSCPDSAVF